jgi:hypothetical protein
VTTRLAPIALLLGVSLACAGAPVGASAPATQVSLSQALTPDCLDLPRSSPTAGHHAEVATFLETGDQAVDFTLRDVDGHSWTLSQLLADKPVLLIEGSWTCPRFQENRAALERTVKTYGDAVHVVLVYTIEAHPQAPDPGPYHGKPKPKEYSDRGQARSYDDRLRSAREIAATTSALVLVDDFDAPGANPVWCTYGTCASCAWLIARDGRIAAHHLWHDPPSMDASIQALLSTRN